MSIIDQHIRARQLDEVLAGKMFVDMQLTRHFDTQLRIGFSNFRGLEVTHKQIDKVFVDGDYILIRFVPGIYLLYAGREILYHKTADTLPKAYGVRFTVDDGAYLTIHIPGMAGCLHFNDEARYLERKDFSVHTRSNDRLSALDEQKFTIANFKEYLLRKNTIVCSAFTHIANIGYLPDVLYAAHIHPRTRNVSLNEAELRCLYEAVRQINREMFEAHGECLEKDVYGVPGGYRRKMAGHLSHKPCPVCATPVEKQVNITGMAFYFCPHCQPLIV